MLYFIFFLFFVLKFVDIMCRCFRYRLIYKNHSMSHHFWMDLRMLRAFTKFNHMLNTRDLILLAPISLSSTACLTLSIQSSFHLVSLHIPCSHRAPWNVYPSQDRTIHTPMPESIREHTLDHLLEKNRGFSEEKLQYKLKT